jgi:cysteine desulfurase
MIYLDHNATSPLLPQARMAWLDAVEQFPGNPSSPHRLGARADRALDEARHRLAQFLGCSPTELIWTSGATEACNTALSHAAARAEPGAPVWISAIEHPAVRDSAQHFFRDRLRFIPVDSNGRLELGWLSTHLARERPALVAVMAANNETGVLQPWGEVHALCAAREVAFFCDATQWCGRLPMRSLGTCDFVAGSAHKFGGPRGVGFLKVPARAPFVPLLRGGPQEERRRAGTENVAGILSAIAALEWCEQQIAAGIDAQHRGDRDGFERELAAALPAIRINGAAAGTERLWNTVSVIMPNADCRVRWVVKFDKAGFAVSTGSACSSGSEEPSPVLTAMGLAADEAARALRFSSGWLTPDTAWADLRAALRRIHAEVVSGTEARSG